MSRRFPPGHNRAKAIIKACAAADVAIEYLADAPRFRFTPASEQVNWKGERVGESVRDLEAKATYAKPTKRGAFTPKAQPHMRKLKTWKPAGLSLAPMYAQPMAGDDSRLTRARRLYSEGDPAALRLWIAQLNNQPLERAA